MGNKMRSVQIQFLFEFVVLPDVLLLVEGLVKTEVLVLFDSLPKEHIDSFESSHVKTQLVLQQFLDGIQFVAIVDIEIHQLGLILTWVNFHHVLQVKLDVVPIIIYYFTWKRVYNSGVTKCCFVVNWSGLQWKEVYNISISLAQFFFVLTPIDEACFESMLLKKRTEDLSSGSSAKDQCIFVLKINVATITLLNSKYISICPTQLSLQILVNSVKQAMFSAHLSLFYDRLL